MYNRDLMRAFAVLGLVGLTGCASNDLVGTWRGAEGQPGSFTVGGMTLAADGTYTAYANYGGDTRGFSGAWTVEGDELVLGDGNRRYLIERDGDSLTLTDPQTTLATALERQH